jgi:hypothetical protein
MTSHVRRRTRSGTSCAGDFEQARQRLVGSYGLREFRLAVLGRVVFLDGFAPSYQAKRLAGAAAALLVGHLSVVSRLRVTPSRAASLPALARAAVAPVKRGKEPYSSRPAAAKIDSGTRSAA